MLDDASGVEEERLHVLVVDDEPDVRDVLQTSLARAGHRVTVRGDGLSALEVLRAEAVALLVTDLKMPTLGGLDLIREARTIQPAMGTIVVTGFASTETAVEALRQGADDFLAKPFQIDDLRRVVDRVLGARRLLTREQDALEDVREEAASLRQRSVEREEELEGLRRDLSLSRRELQRRVQDLEFVSDLTSLLAKEDDLERVLETTARILTVRFHALVTRIEVVLSDGVHVAQHVDDRVPRRVLTAMGPDLVARAKRTPERVLRDVVLGFDDPLEAFAAPLDLSTGKGGGLVLLRPIRPTESEGDLYLFSLVPRALTIGVEAEVQRRGVVKNALRVATGMLEVLEGRGTFAKGHADRVADMSRVIALEMGLSSRLQAVIQTAGRLHDVGTIGVPDEVLQREGPLSSTERDIVRDHAVLGARILAPFGEAAAFVRHHHERPDGEGYPDGLRGDDIPIGAQIIGVVEAFDAMTHHRAYRPSRSRAEALDEVCRLRGRQFAAAPADALLRLARGKDRRW